MKQSLILTALSLLVLGQLGLAQVAPQTISYQGVLRHPDGTLVPAAGGDTTATITFSLYDAATPTLPVWTETQSVLVSDGLFSVILGKATPFTGIENPPVELGIKVGADAEMIPRVELTSVIYALHADRSDTSEYAQKAEEVSGADNVFSGSGNVGIGTTSPEANLQVLGNWRLGPSASGTPPTGADNWLNANNGILYEGGGADWTHHFSAYGAGDIARFGISTGVGLAPDTRVVITNSGNVGIGITTPAFKLDVAGDVKADNVILPATTRYYSIPAWEFKGSFSTDTVLYVYGWSQVKASAGVHLPHGAVITEFAATLDDSYATNDSMDFDINLWKITPGSAPTSLALVATDGAPGFNTFPYPSPIDHQVDNISSTYLVTAVWKGPPTSSDLKLYSVRIKYTVTKPLP